MIASLLLACAPALVEVPPPDLLAAPAAGPTVEVHYPVDARPAVERRDGGYYDTTVPLPLVTYGDINLRPGALLAVDRAVRVGLAAEGVPVVADDGDLVVRVFVLHHVGTRDISDAQWVSTLTGGIAGTVGKFVYPAFAIVDAKLRIEVSDRDGNVLAVRDVGAFHVERRPYALTWGWLYLWRRNVAREMFRDGFVDVHTRLAVDVAAVVDEARAGGPVTAGLPATEFSAHALDPIWEGADTLDLRNTAEEDAFALAKYGHARFSLVTGHDTAKGEVVGHVGVPLDTFGYEVGVFEDLQAKLDITVLGFYNGLSGGFRWQVADFGASKLSLDGDVGFNVVLLRENRFAPVFAARHEGAGLMLSHRPREVTWFLRAGVFHARVYDEFDAFPDLRRGDLTGYTVGPGAEIQVTPTTILAFRVETSAQFQEGIAVDLGPLGPVLVVPQLSLGLR